MATLNDMRANAEMIASLNPSVPLIADADTGYGGPIMVTRTVTQYARAGVAALHIEDQVSRLLLPLMLFCYPIPCLGIPIRI
jgi:2-methylisocitrate lyase-like PEP mutase family enzyme